MSSFKLRGPSNSSLRDPANSTLRGSDGPLEFLKSLESILTSTNNFEFQPNKLLILVGTLASAIKSTTAVTAFSASLSTLSSFVRNVNSSRNSNLSTTTISQSGISHGVTVGAVSGLMNIQKQSDVQNDLALTSNSLFQKLNSITINRILPTVLNLVPSSNRLVSLSIQSSFTNIINAQIYRLMDILSSASSILIKNVSRSLSLSGAFAIFLITPFTKFVELAIRLIPLFEGAILKSINRSSSLNTNLSTVFSKNLQITLANIINSLTVEKSFSLSKNLTISSSILTTALQNNISKINSLQSSFNSVLSNLTSKTINLTLSTSNQIVAFLSSFISLSINSSVAPNILKDTNTLLSSTLNNSLEIPRLTQTTLAILGNQSLNLLTQSLRFVSLAILSSQSSNIRSLIGIDLNRSVDLLATVNKAPSIILESVLTSFQLALNKSISISKNIILDPLNSLQKFLNSSLSTAITPLPSFQRQTLSTLSQTSSFLSSLTTTTFRLITIALNNLFSTALGRLTSISANVSASTDNQFNKSINYDLQLLNSFTSLILTQSLRFVSLAVISSQNLIQQITINLSLNSSSTLLSSISKQSIVTLQTVATTLSVQFSKTIVYNIARIIDLIVSTSKIVFSSLIVYYLTTLSITRALSVSLSRIASLSINFVKVTSSTITVAVNNLFDADLSKLIQTSIITITNTTNSFSRSVSSNLNAVTSFTNLLLTQSLRFLSLAINSNYSVVFANQIFKIINYSSNLSTVIQKQITQLLNVVNSFGPTLISNINKYLSTVSNISTDIRRSFAKYLNLVSTFETFLSPNSFYDQLLTVTLTNTVNIAVLSLRFVSLAIASSFNTLFQKLNNILLFTTFDAVNSLARQVAIGLSQSITYTSNILSQSFRFVTLSLISTFNANFVRSISSSLFVNLNPTVTYQTVSGKFIEVTSNLGINFNKLINLVLQNISTFFSNVSRGVEFNLNISVLSEFNSLISKIVQSNINGSLSSLQVFSKSVEFTRSTIVTFSTFFAPLSLRFVTFQITSSFASTISRNTSRLIEAISIYSSQVTRFVLTTLAMSLELTTLFIKYINISIVSTLNNTNSIQRSSFFDIKLTNTNVINFVRSISLNIQMILSFSSQIVKAVSNTITISINNLFDGSIQKAVGYRIVASINTINNINNNIFKTIQASISLSSLILTQSLRFVSLSVLSNQDIAQNSSITATIQNLVNFSAAVSKNVYLAIEATTTSLISSVQSFVFITIAASIDFINSFNRSISYLITAVAQNVSNISGRIYYSLTQTFANTINLTQLTANLLSINVNSLLDSTINRSVSYLIDTVAIGSSNFQNNARLNLQTTVNFAGLILTQSLRFVTFAVISAQNILQNNWIYRTLINTTLLPSTIGKNTSSFISTIVANNSVLQTRINYLIAAVNNSIGSLQKTVNYSLSSSFQSILNVSTQSFLTLSNSASFTTELIKTTASLLAVSINSLFESTLNRLTSSTINANLNSDSNLQRFVYFDIKLINSFSSLILTQSLRFVSFVILSTQNVVKQTNTYLSVNLIQSISSNINKNITSLLQGVSNNTATQIKDIASSGVATSLSTVSTIQRSSTINVVANVQSAINIAINGFINLIIASNFVSDILILSAKTVAINLSSLFDTTLEKLISSSRNATFTSTNNISRSIDLSIKSISSFASLILTQSLRFVSLAILITQNITQNIQTFITLNNITSFISTISKSIATSLQFTINNSILQIKNVELLNLLSSFESSLIIQRAIQTSVSVSIQNLSNIATRSFIALNNSSNFMAEVLILSSRSIFMSINSLFDSTIRTLSEIKIEANTSADNNFAKAIASNLNLSSGFTALLLTQSLRFVSLAVLSGQQIMQNIVVSLSINNSSSLTASMVRLSSIIISSALTYFSVLSNNTKLNISVFVDSLVTIQKSVVYGMIVILQSIVSIQSFINISINRSTELVSNLFKATSKTVTVALNNLFEASIQKLTDFAVSTSITASLAFARAIDISVKSINNFVSLVFTQSFRFVSLLIVSGQNLAQQTGISTLVSSASSLSTIAIKNVLTTVQFSFNAFINVSNAVDKLLNLISSSQNNFIKQIDSAIKLETNNLSNLFKAVYIYINANVSLFSQFIKYIASNLSTLSNNILNLNKSVVYQINQTFNNSVQVITKQLASISLNIISSLNSSIILNAGVNLRNIVEFNSQLTINKLFNQLIEVAIVSTFETTRAIAKNVAIINNFTSSILTASFREISLNIQSLFDTQIRSNSTRLLQIFIEPFKFFDYWFGGLANSTFNDSIDAMSGTGTIDGNPGRTLILQKNVGKISDLSNQYLVLLINPFTKFVELTIRLYSLFEPNFVKEIVYGLTSNIYSSINLNKTVDRTFVTINTILTSTIRSFILVSLSIFNLNIIQKSITVNQSLLNIVSMQSILGTLVSFSLFQELIFITTFNKATNIYKNLVSEFNIFVQRSVVSSITLIYSNATILFKNVLVKLLIIVSVPSVLFKNIKVNLNTILSNFKASFNLVAQWFIRFAINSLVDTKFTNTSVSKSLSIVNNAFIDFRKFISTSLNFTSILSSSVLPQSLRFVSLAVISAFSVIRRNLFPISLNISLPISIQINSFRIFFKTLNIFINLPVRRSHTLYGVLTSFATNKSKPGSEGSAQSVQRRSGGSARKRNTTNRGSSFFRRGDTDDLP